MIPATLALRLWAGAARLAAPGLRAMLRRRAARGREVLVRLDERYGIDATPRPPGKLLWLHAASVGEAVSVLPVIAALPADVSVLFTTGTVTSAKLLSARLPELGRAAPVLHRFAPLDVPAWVALFLDHWRPDAAGFVESEIWPNSLRACAARNIPAALINARLSPRSAQRWGLLPGTARALLGGFALIDAQSPADAARITQLGAHHVQASGNLKRAAPPLPVDAAALVGLQKKLGARPCWLAASTHTGDDAVVAQVAFVLRQKFPNLLTIIAPRHPDRGAALAALFGGAPRLALGDGPGAHPVWIADTMGDMGLLYRLCPTVFMGKSFAGGGGQNPLEPARLGCVLVTGPDTANFADDVQRLVAADALVVAKDAAEIAAFVTGMLRTPARRAAMGARAQTVANADADLPEKLAQALADLLPC